MARSAPLLSVSEEDVLAHLSPNPVNSRDKNDLRNLLLDKYGKGLRAHHINQVLDALVRKGRVFRYGDRLPPRYVLSFSEFVEPPPPSLPEAAPDAESPSMVSDSWDAALNFHVSVLAPMVAEIEVIASEAESLVAQSQRLQSAIDILRDRTESLKKKLRDARMHLPAMLNSLRAYV
jgi:hypothetical protein